MSRDILAIHKSIGNVLLYYPGSVGGRTYDSGLFRPYFDGVVGRSAVRPELPLYLDRGLVIPPPCPDHVVVDPHYVREIYASAPPHQIEVAICVSGSSWLGD